MIFTASDVSSLSQSLHRWEIAEYIFEALVAIACAGELVADFGKRCLKKTHRERIERYATILLVLALCMGLWCLIKTNALSGNVIGSLGDKAEEAGRKANTATTNSETALTKSGQALDEANGAEKTAGKAQAIAGTVASKAEELDRQLRTTKKDLDTAKLQLAYAETAEKKEEQALFDMAVCLSSRVIPQGGYFNTITKTREWSTVDLLRPHSNLQAIIDVVQDAEARRAASSIETSLRAAGWTKVTVRPGVGDLRDGVEVIPWNPRELGDKGLPAPDSEARLRRNLVLYGVVSNAADAIVYWLHSFFWQATRSQAINPDIPSDAVEIKVGLYPAVQYVAPPGEKVFSDLYAALKNQQEEAREKMEAEQDQKFEELMKYRPPEMAEEARRVRENTRAMEKQMKARYFSQPCRLLNP
jgi:hypothetical protein